MHQVAALQRCDLQRLLRLGAGTDAQHAGQKEAVRTYREILQCGSGEPAVEGTVSSYQRRRNDAVEWAEAALAACRPLRSYRADVGPQRLDRCNGTLASAALLQYVPAQVGLVERPQCITGVAAVEADTRRHAPVPVTGVVLQSRGGQESAGQIAHLLQQKARRQAHVGGTGAAPRIGQGEAFGGRLTGQLEQQALLVEPLPLERQVAAARGAPVDPIPLDIQQQRVLANHRRKGAFGAAGQVHAPKAQQARAHHVADEHAAALEVAAAHDRLANRGLGGLQESLRGGGNGAAGGGRPVEHRQLADAVVDC